MRRLLPVLLFAILGTTLLMSACGGSDTEQVLRFSAIPDQNSTELTEKFEPLAKHLSEVLGVTVEYIPSRDYQASVEMFKNGDVQLAWFGGLTGVQAREGLEGARAIAQGAVDPEYFSYFVAHGSVGRGQHPNFPAYIRELSFTFGSESSTSGRLMPEYFIRKYTKYKSTSFFTKTAFYSGSHDKTLELVQSGQFQAGVVNYKVYEKRVEEGKINPEMCRIIWKTPSYPDYNWTAHPLLEKRFGEGFIDKLQAALIGIEDSELLAALPREKLIPAKNEDFEMIRQVALDLEMIR